MERTVRPGEFYRHFKNKMYQIVAVAIHSETKEKMVVYQALYGDYGVYVRPYEMFISEVDREKYPNVKQKYRFERIDPASLISGQVAGSGLDMEKSETAGTNQQTAKTVGANEETEKNEEIEKIEDDQTDDFELVDLGEETVEEEKPDPNFLRFLETDSYEVRMECLKKMLHTASQRDIDSMYLVLDMKPESGSVEEQVDAIARFLRMQYRYDGSRLR